MATNLDRPQHLETWIGHPHGLRLRRHPRQAEAIRFLDEFPMVIRFSEIIERSGLPASAQPTLRVETLPAFRQSSVGLTVELRLEISLPGSGPEPRMAKITASTPEAEVQEFAVLRAGKRQVVTFPFPEFSEAVDMHVSVEIRDEGRVDTVARLVPEKKWTFHVAFQTHLDLGWTDRADRVIAALRKMTSVDAVDICREFGDRPEGQRFVWTCECSEALRYAWEGGDAAQRKALLECIDRGLIQCCVLPFTFHTNLMSRRLLSRAIQRSFELRREIGAEHMLDLSVAQQNDVPGHNWVLPDLLAEAGVRRAVLGHNWLVKGCPLPPLFRWIGPDGGEVLALSTTCVDYGGASGLPTDPRDLRGLSLNNPDGAQVDGTALFRSITYGENCGPAFASRELGSITRWQDEFVWPKLKVGGPKDYFNHLEAEIDYGSLPVVDREISDWWLDGPASMPTAMGKFRRAQRLFDLGASTPELEENLTLFAEHTFGLNAQLVKVKAAEAGWQIEKGFEDYIASWHDKEAYADAAMAEARSLAARFAGKSRVVAEGNPGSWEIVSDAHGVARLTDPEGTTWVDASASPGLPRFGSVVQKFLPRETGSWFHHDLPFAPHQGSHLARVLASENDGSSIVIRQKLESPAGSISDIAFRLENIGETGILRAELMIQGKEATAQSETLALGLPFLAGKPIYSGDVGGRMLHVDRDQLPGSNRDGHAFGLGWMLEDGGKRLLVSSPDIFLWHFGGLWHGNFNHQEMPRTGEVYAHLFNNAWQTNFRVWIEGDMKFAFYLKSLAPEESPLPALERMAELWWEELPRNSSDESPKALAAEVVAA